ncbi:MAG: hypothetical protein HDKAJFGB_02211 [Anaerolineae bacterium]|nr:hypothetical protein [Anaerolineae bacterium]
MIKGVAVGADVGVAARVGVAVGGGGVCEGVAVTTTTRGGRVAAAVGVTASLSNPSAQPLKAKTPHQNNGIKNRLNEFIFFLTYWRYRGTIVPSFMSAVPPPPPPRRLRLIQILTVAILVVAFATTIFFLFDPTRRAQLEALINSPLGLAVIFFLSLISNATLILPVPGLALTALAATAGNPLAIGIVAGLGQALGETTGYLAGYSSQTLIDSSPRYTRMASWMQRYGALTIFILALIPNPFFDAAGIVAGALRMRFLLYLGVTIAGKVIKNVALAYAAAGGVDWFLG